MTCIALLLILVLVATAMAGHGERKPVRVVARRGRRSPGTFRSRD